MKLFDSIRGAFTRSTTKAAAKKTVEDSPRTTGRYPLLSSGSPLTVATVYRCVNLLADSVANLPMQYMRLKGDVFVEDKTSRLHYLLTVQPCSYMSAVDFFRQIVLHLQMRGNAYVVPVFDYTMMDWGHFALVEPSCVAHDTVNDKYTICDVNAGISGVFGEDEIIHIKNYSIDGKTGLSTIGFARLALDITSTGDRETLNRFANGGNVRGLVSNDTSVRGFGEYQDEELEKTATNLDERFQNGARIVSLPGQVQFSPISLSSTDMQFLETRKFSVREICRFFGVHPSFVFDDTSNNYKSAEMANVAFLSNTLNPILRKIELEFHRKLVAPSLCCKRKFQFDRKGIYACDLDSKVRYQTQTIAAGLYTVNDWRREENKPAVEGGDTVLVSANLKAINEAGAAPVNEPIESNNDGEE